MSNNPLFRGLATFVTPQGETNTIKNIQTLRSTHACDMLIEVWCKKDTLTPEFLSIINDFNNVNVCYLDVHVSDVDKWNRESVKAIMTFYSDSQDVIVFNDDVLFDKDPAFILDISDYRPDGVVLFPYKKAGFSPDSTYCEFVKRFIGEKEDNFPVEQLYVFGEGNNEDQREFYQDNGVFVINRTNSIKVITFMLNTIRQIHESGTEYPEMFFSQALWLSLVKEKKGFFISQTPHVMLPDTLTGGGNLTIGSLFIDDKLCYSRLNYVEPEITNVLEESLRQITITKQNEAVLKIRENFAGVHNADKVFSFKQQMEAAEKMYNARYNESGTDNEVIEMLDAKDDNIDTIMHNTNCDEEVAQRILNENDGDIVDTIISIHGMQEGKSMSEPETTEPETTDLAAELSPLPESGDTLPPLSVADDVRNDITKKETPSHQSARDKLNAFKQKKTSSVNA